MAEYDITMKRLTAEFPEDYVRFALGVERFSVAPLDVASVDKELPSLLREVDFAARVQVEGKEFILLLESQTWWERAFPERMFFYVARLREQYRLPVYPVALFFRFRGKVVSEWGMEALGEEVVRFRYRAIRLWEAKAEKILEAKLSGLYPLLPLMEWGDRSGEEVLATSARLIEEGIVDGERRADAYVGLMVLAGMKYGTELVRRILRRREIMLESPVYREILQEGEERGKVLGWEQGHREGLSEAIALGLELKFGPKGMGLLGRIRKVRDVGQLEALKSAVRVAESLADVESALEEVR